MIERAIAILKQAGFDLTSEELADILWLATQIGSSQEETDTDTELPELIEPSFIRSFTNNSPTINSPPLPSSISEPQNQAQVYTPRNRTRPKSENTASSIPIKIPAATALPDALAIGRSLRPLMRKIPSPTQTLLDEEATVRRIVEQKNWIPVLKAAPTRWLELAIVMEYTSSTAVWQPTLKELQHLLEHHGAFRDVRTWQLTFDSETPKLWTKNKFKKDEKRFHSPQELIDPSQRRLILLVSDCISPAWYNKTIYPLLQLWGTKGMVSILQLLPNHLWYRTALESGTYVQLRSLTPGVPNTQLKATDWEGQENNDPLKIPIITLEPNSLYNWSQVIAGNGSVTTTGVSFNLDSINVTQNPQQKTQLPPLQRVSRFRATASPTAQRLAGLLAATPVSLPIVHLIQRKMLPNSRQIHVAEVFMSGLLEPIQTNGIEYQEYEFIEGVREKLLEVVPKSQSTEVIYQLSEYIAKRLGISINEFEARLMSPQIAGKDSLLRPFATITAQVLKQLGGEYLDFAEEIESYLNYTPLENSRHLLWQHGNTKIYSLLTDTPWLLPFDALVISRGKSGGMGSFGYAFLDFLGQNNNLYLKLEDLLLETIEQKAKKQGSASPLFFVPLPSEINQNLSQFSREMSNRYVICVDIEPRPSTKNIKSVTKAIINLATERNLTRLVIPLLGTGLHGLSVKPVANSMLEAIATEIQSLESNPIQEITFVNKDRTKHTILNEVAQRLFTQPEKPSLSRFIFKTVTVNRQGEIIKRENHIAQYFTEILPNYVPLEMVYIPGGTFLMGSPEGEGNASERPQHQVTVPAFFMGKYPITQKQWKTVAFLPRVKRDLNPNPSHFKGEDRPVEQVEWYDAEEFCLRLSQHTGKVYRLPSEAEWEYACRAGTTTPFYFGETITGDLANYDAMYRYDKEQRGKSQGETTSVEHFSPNAFGLYDIHGNVWEWCADIWHDNYQGAPNDGRVWDEMIEKVRENYVRRGGSWFNYPRNCRSACRFSFNSTNVINDIGFRVVCGVG